MSRYFLTLSYDGTAYHGWQTQPGASSVQETIEQALAVILRVPTSIVGAGRTDAGVHASCMVAHFDVSTDLPPDFLRRLNSLLPKDIAIQQVRLVTDEAHARFSATSRTYHYHIITRKDPFRRDYAHFSYSSLDVGRMNQAAELLLGTHDFTSFSKLHTDVKTNICRVTNAKWVIDDNGHLQFTITADRFLRNMVRAVVGTLLEVGRGKLSIEAIEQIMSAKDRCAAGSSVAACGLFLTHITYPEELFP